MHRFFVPFAAYVLTADACIAQPDDAIAQALAEANVPGCFQEQEAASFQPLKPWRYDLPGGAVLWGFPCMIGAYNSTWSIVVWTENGHRLVSLPIPLVTASDNGDSFVVTGMVSETRIQGASYDPESGLLKSIYAYRARHDAASIGYWQLIPDRGLFRLIRYETDQAMDSKLDLLPVIGFE
jgi:hypothetical protein